MATIYQLAGRLESDLPLTVEEITFWSQESDIDRAAAFYGPDLAEAKRCAQRISETLVTKYLNNPDKAAVPLENKSRVCLILNNFALHKPIRGCVFEVLDKLEVFFEESIKEEARLKFNPELGRMSEHVAVLLMRVTGYKLKAANVLEFTDGNTQFSVQLMLALLLKEPAYEMGLLCNCITALLGFTQPQAFFDSSKAVEETSCFSFTEKIDFILHLMLRLKAVQSLSDVLTEQLDEMEVMTPLLHVATCSAMRCIMNIFRFSSENSTQWRKHILLSTTFLDHSVTLYLLMQCDALQRSLEGTGPELSTEMLRGISLGYKFASLCTFRMNRHASVVRLFSLYLHDMLQLSMQHVRRDSPVAGALMRVYVDMFHFMSNIDALGGEEYISPAEIPNELLSASLLKSIEAFLQREVAPGGLAWVQAWHTALKTVEADTLVDRGSRTFTTLERLFGDLEASVAAQTPPPVPAPAAGRGGHRFLGELPSLRPKQVQAKVPIETAAAVEDTQQRIAVVRRDVIEGVDPVMLCALTGNVMKNPVVSPYGHTFEQQAILAWIAQNGSVCPITGKPLPADALKPNKEVAARIMKQVIQQSMAAYNQENEADLYDF
ncbi:putative U-box domain protein [Trypanosoma conorhini]|uniref:Putative U-box domain protein n=1 Tax=Trypanosoma conorhini TaxID=83891 RepID=A0A422PWB5_9TRYP|nr:putative U-box domain protein [Trypanosoma conorhini]RNF22034.1 putative U-box domain protein [Trypanosoma conorhini]